MENVNDKKETWEECQKGIKKEIEAGLYTMDELQEQIRKQLEEIENINDY